jgi:hypothetical protein
MSIFQFHGTKTCSLCGYTGTDFGKDASQEDGVTRYCRPCTRAKTAKSAKVKADLITAWHRSPDYQPGTKAPDSWRIANGFSPRKGRTPTAAELAAAAYVDTTTPEEYEIMAHGPAR